MSEPIAIPNILASRYASQQMNHIWDFEEKIRRERLLWLCILKAQRELGVDIPAASEAAFEAKVHDIDLASIAEREARTHHDLKARIEEFCSLAGYEHIHLGLTSRDITENIEQSQVRDSLLLLRGKATALLACLCSLTKQYASLAMAGRTHNMVAQATTLGKRFATCGEEIIAALEVLDSQLERMKLRGIKGAVGSQQDLLQLFEGHYDKVEQLEQRVAEHLGFERVQAAAAQIYPRSFDLEFVSSLVQLVSGPVSLTLTLRLMAGHGHVSEGFLEGQVGSSAMPHKKNPRLSERIAGLKTILVGHLAMASELTGAQWNEGDVSCSVVRRVMLPDACFACDAVIDTFLAVLEELEVSEQSLDAEVQDWLVALGSSKVLNAAVALGVGREEAHKIISRHVHATGDESFSFETIAKFASELGGDKAFPLNKTEVMSLMGDTALFKGTIAQQIEQFLSQAEVWLERFPQAKEYEASKPV